MELIVYKEIKNANQDVIEVQVFMGNKRIGSIDKEVGGWRYFPKGHTVGGELLPSIRAVKNSLESE